MRYIPLYICHDIYDILVEHAGAPEKARMQFVRNYGNPGNRCKPLGYRICKRWGDAGWFMWNKNCFYVSGRNIAECSDKAEFLLERKEIDAVNDLLILQHDRFDKHRTERGYLDAIPSFSQHQGSLTDQLKTLIRVANKIGLQDAADYISRNLERCFNDYN